MATVTSRPPTPHRVDPQVLHPLDRLRGTIRRYVVIEGLLSAAIFVAAWFALGMLFDFGLFKVATWDWVVEAPVWVRGAALGVAVLLLAALIALRIARRLTKELSYPALALVLERRFPAVLGDRLITAVELADLDQQARYGYSADMIRQTVEQARERVGTVPVNEVFDWRRLRRMALIAAGLLLAVVVVGYVSFAAATRSADPYRFGWRFAHVAGTFLNRNLALGHEPWPRRAHLELLDFPTAERRIGKDDPPTTVRVKAYRWVVADPAAPMGWRPMRWADLTENLAGGPVPTLPAAAFRSAADAGELGDDPAAWPLDAVQAIGLDDVESRTKLLAALPGPEYEAVRTDLERVFAALDRQAASPSMGRRLRKLDLPEKVTLAYAGQTKTGDVSLGAMQHQEYAAPVSDLKESVYFDVRAEDFRTGPRGITLIPPPLFKTLARTEYQPAYLHHAPPQGEGYSDLRGLRQRMPEKALSLTGDRSAFTVPSGTELVLTATTDVDLTAAYVQPRVGTLPGAKPGSGDWLPVPVGADGRTVTVEFRGDYRLAAGRTFDHYFVDDDQYLACESVTSAAAVELDLIVEQADGVKARRQIAIQVAEDQPPTVEVAVDTIRRVGSVYYVTPKARIPFNPESYVRDDQGLSRLAYEVTYWAEDSDVGRALRAQLAARAFLPGPAPVGVPAAVAPVLHAAKFRDLDKGDNRQTGSFGVARFADLQRGLRQDTRAFLLQRLAEPLAEAGRTVAKVDLKSPDEDFFDVKSLKLLANVTEVQSRYRVDLNVVATDTNYDTGPKTGQTPEPIRLLVVSEGDLLAEINKEEEAFAVRLDEALAKLAAAKKTWEVVRSQNAPGTPADPGSVDNVTVKVNDVALNVGKARDVVQAVVRDYRRIHRESVVNDVTELTRDKFGTFANRIDRLLGENPPPVTKEERAQFQAGGLRPKTDFPAVEKQIEAVRTPLAGSPAQWAEVVAVSDAGVGLLLLEQELRSIRDALGELQSLERLKSGIASIIKKQEGIGKELQEWRIRLEGDLLRKDPKISPVGPVFLTKGEAKKVKHQLNWRQYDKDDLVVKITVTDKDKKPVAADALGVPAQLKLNFEQNQTDFEYEVKAGGKDGEFVLTVTPEVGDPVSLPVTVK